MGAYLRVVLHIILVTSMDIIDKLTDQSSIRGQEPSVNAWVMVGILRRSPNQSSMLRMEETSHLRP